jgi:hypothetical protein
LEAAAFFKPNKKPGAVLLNLIACARISIRIGENGGNDFGAKAGEAVWNAGGG